MKNKLITLSLLLILIGTLVVLENFLLSKTDSEELVSPVGKNILQQITRQKISPTPSSTPTPIIYNFNKSTDLQTELETINPEVLDSDFGSLKQITTSI